MSADVKPILLSGSDLHGVPRVFEVADGLDGDSEFAGSFVVRVETRTAYAHPFGGFLLGFSRVCPHMGCHLVRSELDHQVEYDRGNHEKLTCGPCPCHGTTFDLLKQGLVVLGPATQNLAQLTLAVNESNEVVPNGWEPLRVDPCQENWPWQDHGKGARRE